MWRQQDRCLKASYNLKNQVYFSIFFYQEVFAFEHFFEQETFLEGKLTMQLRALRERAGVLLLRLVQMRLGATACTTSKVSWY